MELQKKTILVFIGLLTAFLILITLFFSTILLSSYGALEEQYVTKDLDHAVNTLNEDLSSLAVTAADWGCWDDSYAFVAGENPAFVQSNLQPASFENLNLNLLVITDTRGEILFSGAYDIENRTMVPAPPLFRAPLDPGNPLMNLSDPLHTTAGILMLEGEPVLIVSQAVVRSDFSGTPRGVLIMGRNLNEAEVARLARLTQPSLVFIRAEDPVLGPDLVSRIRTTHGTAPGLVEPLNREQVRGYALLSDLYGNGVLVLRITETRDIYQYGLNTTLNLIFIILAGGLVLGLGVIALMDRAVLKRISSLVGQVQSIGRIGSFGNRVEVSGDDELSGLAGEINRMLGTIEEFHAQLTASEARFRELAELLPQIIFEIDTGYNLTYVNRFAMEQSGLTEEDLRAGVNARQVLVPGDIDRMLSNLKKRAAGEKPAGEIYTLIKKDRSFMKTILISSPIIRDGRLVGFRGSGIDITERVRLEEALAASEEYLQTLIRSIRAGIVVIDTETHTILDVNPAALELMGTTKDAVLNQRCHKIICPAEVGRCPITDLHHTVDNSERTLLTPDGREISIIKYVVPVTLHGRPCLLETFIDNSYRKRIELELAESEEKYRALAENSADIIFSLDKAGLFTYISPQVSRYGFSPADIIGRAFHQFIHADDRARVLENYLREMREGRSIASTFRILDRAGSLRWLEENSTIRTDTRGAPVGIVGVLRDVTDRVLAEDALRESRERLANILRACPVIVFETDPDGYLLFASELWEQLTGHPFAGMKGRHWSEILHPDDRVSLAPAMRRQSRERGITCSEGRIVRPDGSVVWIYGQSVTIYTADGGISGHVGTITDITGRKRMEENLVESEDKYRALTENTDDVLFSMDMAGIFTYISPQINKYGFLAEEITGKTLRNFIYPEDADRVDQEFRRDLERGAQFHSMFRLPDKWGHIHWLDQKSTLRLDQSGTPVGIYGVLRDYSERKQAEDALIELKNLYMAIFDNTGSATIIDAEDTSIILANQKWAELSGLPRNENIGLSWTRFIHPEDLEMMKKYHYVRRSGPENAPREYSFRLVDASGIIHYCLVSVVMIPGTRNSIAAVVDISDQKRVEQAIELANRKLNLMNSITRHDILNTVTGLIGCVDMAKAATSPEERMSLLNDIRDLSRNVQRQIAFTKEYQEVGVRVPLWQNAHDVITRILPNFKNSSLQIFPDLLTVEIYADPLLEKVFYNLVDNAIRYGETITTITFSFRIAGNDLIITCEDDGVGVPPAEKTRIFERGVGKNTGMGLFLTAEILGITGITIMETGVYRKGARFEIHVPRGMFRLDR